MYPTLNKTLLHNQHSRHVVRHQRLVRRLLGSAGKFRAVVVVVSVLFLRFARTAFFLPLSSPANGGRLWQLAPLLLLFQPLGCR
jgi:hypothetical protein